MRSDIQEGPGKGKGEPWIAPTPEDGARPGQALRDKGDGLPEPSGKEGAPEVQF